METSMMIVQYPQERDDEQIRSEIIHMQRSIWEDDTINEYPEHPDTFVSAFLLMEENHVVAHVALHQLQIQHHGISYLAAGICEVMCDKQQQGKGYGTKLLRHVFTYLQNGSWDLSLFTCHAHLQAFYQRIGWQYAKDLCFVGGKRSSCMRSDELQLSVMYHLYSSLALDHHEDFETGDLYVWLGERRMW